MPDKQYEIVVLDYKIDGYPLRSAIKHYTSAAPAHLAGKYGCPTCGRTVAKDDLRFTWRGPMCPGCDLERTQPPAPAP